MEDNKVEEEITAQAVFNKIAEKFLLKQEVTENDIEYLIGLIGGLDVHLRIAHEMLSTALKTTQELLEYNAITVLKKCGRTDKKIETKILKLCEDTFNDIVNITRLKGLELQKQLIDVKETE